MEHTGVVLSFDVINGTVLAITAPLINTYCSMKGMSCVKICRIRLPHHGAILWQTTCLKDAVLTRTRKSPSFVKLCYLWLLEDLNILSCDRNFEDVHQTCMFSPNE